MAEINFLVSQSDTFQVKLPILVKQTYSCYKLIFRKQFFGRKVAQLSEQLSEHLLVAEL